tara:strand:- start:915 stop:3128 length:2214 start_codon:yes stop_codon:yes gene_type:complete
MAKGVNLRLGADITDFQSKLKIANRAFKKTANILKSTGKSLSMGLTAPILAIGAAAVSAAAGFEKSMNKVSAVTGATGKNFTKLETQAKQLGRTTQFSASQAADAMGFLGMAGFSTEQIMSAMPATLDLAAAGSLDLADAADIASNIMSGFGAEAEDLSSITDVLAKGFTSTNTDLQQLGDAMAEVAPVASGFGISIEETTAAIGLLSNAGIQGGKAGTTLKNILVKLDEESTKLGLSVFDAAGNMIPLADQMEQLESKGLSTSEIMESFKKIAGPGMLAMLKEGSTGLRDLTTDLENSGGTAKKVADTQLKGFAGAMVKLKSATEGLAIEFGDVLIPLINKMVKFLNKVISKWTALDSDMKIVIVTIGIFAAAIGPVIYSIGLFTSAVALVTGGVTTLVGAIKIFKIQSIAAWLAAYAPVIAIIAAIALVAAAVLYVTDNLEVFGQIGKMMAVSLGNAFLEIGKMIITPFEKGIDAYNKLRALLGKDQVANPFSNMKESLENLKGEVPKITAEFGTFGEAMKNAGDKAKGAIAGVGASLGLSGGGSEGGGSEGGSSGGSSGGSGGSGGESGGGDGGGLIEKMQSLTEASKEFGLSMANDFAGGLANAVTSGENFFKSMSKIFVDLLKQIAALIIKAAILAALFAMIPGMGGVGVATGFKDILTGSLTGKASGGSVVAGQPYMVGESGAEMFVPNNSGSIVANNNLGGSVIPDVRISGSDLMLVFNRENKRRNGVNR